MFGEKSRDGRGRKGGGEKGGDADKEVKEAHRQRKKDSWKRVKEEWIYGLSD